MLESAGAATTVVRRPAELAGLDGIVLPGGESTTIHKLAVAFDLFEPLRAAIRDGLPALGTCAGMILLADQIEGGIDGQETLGGLDVVVRRNAFGRQVDSFEATVEFTPSWGEAMRVPATFIRAPWVEKVGDGVEVLASVASGPHEGRVVAVRQGPVMATSFHPEWGAGDRIHRLFLDLL